MAGPSFCSGFIGVPVPPAQFLAIPFFDMVMFSLFLGWAVWARRDPQAHKRLILFATINMVDAAVARLPMALPGTFPLTTFYASWIVIAAIAIWDLVTLKRLHPVTIIAGVLTVVVQFGRLAIMGTDGWTAFANWLIAALQG